MLASITQSQSTELLEDRCRRLYTRLLQPDCTLVRSSSLSIFFQVPTGLTSHCSSIKEQAARCRVMRILQYLWLKLYQ